MKLIVLVIFILFLAFTVLSTAVEDPDQEGYVFQAGETYVYDAVIRRWKLLVPAKN